MNSLIYINENIFNGYSDNILYLLYFVVIIFGILVITYKNPIISVLFLIGLFSIIASYLIIIGFHFIGLSYLIVYVGAVSILFLFILMLINIRISELQENTNNNIPLILIILFFFFGLLTNSFLNLLPLKETGNKEWGYIFSNNNNQILHVFDRVWDYNIAQADHMTSLGYIIYTNYNIWLIITSIILLLAMVGTIVITMKQNT